MDLSVQKKSNCEKKMQAVYDLIVDRELFNLKSCLCQQFNKINYDSFGQFVAILFVALYSSPEDIIGMQLNTQLSDIYNVHFEKHCCDEESIIQMLLQLNMDTNIERSRQKIPAPLSNLVNICNVYGENAKPKTKPKQNVNVHTNAYEIASNMLNFRDSFSRGADRVNEINGAKKVVNEVGAAGLEVGEVDGTRDGPDTVEVTSSGSDDSEQSEQNDDQDAVSDSSGASGDSAGSSSEQSEQNGDSDATSGDSVKGSDNNNSENSVNAVSDAASDANKVADAASDASKVADAASDASKVADAVGTVDADTGSRQQSSEQRTILDDLYPYADSNSKSSDSGVRSSKSSKDKHSSKGSEEKRSERSERSSKSDEDKHSSKSSEAVKQRSSNEDEHSSNNEDERSSGAA